MLPPLAISWPGLRWRRAQRLAGSEVADRILSALACFAFPVLVVKLPGLMSGDPQPSAPGMPIALAVLISLVLAVLCLMQDRAISVALVALLAGVGYLWIKVETFPYIDQAATARPVSRQLQSINDSVCVKDVPRDWRYGLNYYTEKPLPDCWQRDPSARVHVYYHEPSGRSRAAMSVMGPVIR